MTAFLRHRNYAFFFKRQFLIEIIKFIKECSVFDLTVNAFFLFAILCIAYESRTHLINSQLIFKVCPSPPPYKIAGLRKHFIYFPSKYTK